MISGQLTVSAMSSSGLSTLRRSCNGGSNSSLLGLLWGNLHYNRQSGLLSSVTYRCVHPVPMIPETPFTWYATHQVVESVGGRRFESTKSSFVPKRGNASIAPLLSSSPPQLPPKPSNLTVIESLEIFQKIVAPPELKNFTTKKAASHPLVVIFYHAQFSGWTNALMPEFYSLAASRPSLLFLTVDVEAFPRAAYHGEISSVPCILLSHCDDAYRQIISSKDYAESDGIIQKAQAAIDKFYTSSANKKPQFKHSWYTHNITVDNLNIHNVGWPSS